MSLLKVSSYFSVSAVRNQIYTVSVTRQIHVSSFVFPDCPEPLPLCRSSICSAMHIVELTSSLWLTADRVFEVKAINEGFWWKGDYVERSTPALIHSRTSEVNSWFIQTGLFYSRDIFSCQWKLNKSLKEIVFLRTEAWWLHCARIFFLCRWTQTTLNVFVVLKDFNHPFYWFCSHLFLSDSFCLQKKKRITSSSMKLLY